VGVHVLLQILVAELIGSRSERSALHVGRTEGEERNEEEEEEDQTDLEDEDELCFRMNDVPQSDDVGVLEL